jgi:hypothetical protein
MFTELAERKKLILIVPGKRIYDFTKYIDLQAFQKDMHDAYSYLATHVKYMNDARDQKMRRGQWGGGALPAPYMIDRSAWKDDQIPLIYSRWLEPAVDLFKLFKAYDFSLGRLCRYIESLPYLFPAPLLEDTQRFLFRTNMRCVPDGYTFSDISSVKYYLSNLTLGGYAKIGEDDDGNELLLPNAFDAAIPFDLLSIAYAAITGSHIDGTAFEGPINTRRYMKSNPLGPKVLFPSAILTSDQGHISTDAREVRASYICFQGLAQEGYTLKIRSGLVSTKILWTLPAQELDRIIVLRLFELAEQDSELADRVKAVFDSMKGQGENEANILARQIDQTQKQIQRYDFLLTDTTVGLDVVTAKKYAKSLAELRPLLTRLLSEQKARPNIDPEETIANFYFVLSHLSTEFQKQSTDVQRQMMSKLVKRIVINNVSPHLFHLYIIWQDGIATRPDVALLWRGMALTENEQWNEEAQHIVRTYWPTGQQLEIMQRLPLNTWTSIRQHANALGVFRSKEVRAGRRKVNSYHETMTYADLEAAMQYTQAESMQGEQPELFPTTMQDATAYDDEEAKAYMCEQVNELAIMTGKGKLSAYWPWSVDVVGFRSLEHDEVGLSRRCR